MLVFCNSSDNNDDNVLQLQLVQVCHHRRQIQISTSKLNKEVYQNSRFVRVCYMLA